MSPILLNKWEEIIIKSKILSASRRTDIPAFYSEWFIRRIREGWVVKYNPYNKQDSYVTIRPEEVAAIFFWSKNYLPLIPYLDELDNKGYNCIFHFTITGYPNYLEPNVPGLKEALKAFKSLASRYSYKQVLWRYDPILFTTELDYFFHKAKFHYLCEELQGYTDQVYISFMNLYDKVSKRLSSKNIPYKDCSLETKINLAHELAEIANSYNIKVYSCCDDYLLDSNRIEKASCINKYLVEKMFNTNISNLTKRPSRKGCGCYESIDIGVYDTCKHKCVYCYANNNEERIEKNYNLHAYDYPALHKGIQLSRCKEEEKSKEYKQMAMFD